MLIKYLRLVHAFARAFWILWIKFPKLDREQKLKAIQQWSQDTLKILGICVMHQTPLMQFKQKESPMLLVANHVSWVDALIIQSIQPSIFVAKSEVKRWPIVGNIATGCGVVFVDRGSPSSARRMVDDVASALHHGYCVAGFPEGTSSEGNEVSLFHANLFEAAINHQVPVLPLAIRYTNPNTGALCMKAAFVGDIGFVASLHQVMSTPGIQAKIHIGDTLSPTGHSRRTLAHLSHRSVSQQLELLNA
ncbi:MAG: 1-acyl-sn-glycerol-3-phosphate acyltransferase [Pseudomonadota bacterium]|jgi:1-acyl-sn-glycerol-3-phosphate acyltransferase